ncbi:MAG: hypothetical protein J4G09_14210 [Proteobacteria bacterium]|nr:hypothetical protein [Pseudomonadota bacterium]
MKIAGIGLAVLLALAGAILIYQAWVNNPRVARELRERPDGERANKVMLIALPSGREIPVNYLEKDGNVYAASDGAWWRELRGEGGRVALLVQGRELAGRARAIRNDPELRSRIFDELRPSAPKLFGVLVEVTLDE